MAGREVYLKNKHFFNLFLYLGKKGTTGDYVNVFTNVVLKLMTLISKKELQCHL